MASFIADMLRICANNADNGFKVVSAETLDELLEKGCAKLNLNRDEVKLTTLDDVDVEDDDGIKYAIDEKVVIIFTRRTNSKPNLPYKVSEQNNTSQYTRGEDLEQSANYKSESHILNKRQLQTKLQEMFAENMDIASNILQNLIYIRIKYSDNLILEELTEFGKDFESISHGLNVAMSLFEKEFKQEMQVIDDQDGIQEKDNTMFKFQSSVEQMEENSGRMLSLIGALTEKYSFSPEGDLARSIRLLAIGNDLELPYIADSELKIYKLPMLETHRDTVQKLKRFELGEPINEIDHQYILLIGMTGVGKSLLINNMVNYLFGVRHEDAFRFKLIVASEEISEREDGASRSEANSMTSWVTSYTFHWQEGLRIPYSLTIVDTPGFGDTRGVKYDEMIVDQINHFFSNRKICPTENLSCIGFLIQASQARLTSEQKYIFDQILNIFGKDVAKNIFLIITFADSSDPPALEVIKDDKIPFANNCVFKFQNAALYAPRRDKLLKYCWDFGYESLKKYFDALKKTPPVNLTLTKEVLNEREQLREILIGLESKIEEGMKNLESIENETKILDQFEKDITQNKCYKVKITVTKYFQKKTRDRFKNCKVCQSTCHRTELLARFSEFVISVFELKNECDVCGCSSSDHVIETFKYTPQDVTEEMTNEDIYAKYNVASDAKNSKKKVLEKMVLRYREIKMKLLESIKRAHMCSAKLEQTALRNTYLTNIQFIERMIFAEQCSSNSNKEHRIEQLHHMKKMAQILSSAKQNPNDITHELSEYEKNVMKKIESFSDG